MWNIGRVPQVRRWFMNLGLALEFFRIPTQSHNGHSDRSSPHFLFNFGLRSGATVYFVKPGALPLRFLQGWASPQVHDRDSFVRPSNCFSTDRPPVFRPKPPDAFDLSTKPKIVIPTGADRRICFSTSLRRGCRPAQRKNLSSIPRASQGSPQDLPLSCTPGNKFIAAFHSKQRMRP
jgi:hypothetical protein